jgi:hypothetical protein
MNEDEVSKAASEESLQILHAKVCEALVEAIKPDPIIADGVVVGHKPNAAALNVARQMLKDNGIQAVRAKGSAMDKLANSIPTTFDDDEDSHGLAH